MTAFEFLMLCAMVVQILAWLFLHHAVSVISKDQEATRESLSRHWREHKDDYWEVRTDHNRLAEALGMEKVGAVPSRYVKSGETK